MGGVGGERKREKYLLVASFMYPNQGLNLQPSYVS